MKSRINERTTNNRLGRDDSSWDHFARPVVLRDQAEIPVKLVIVSYKGYSPVHVRYRVFPLAPEKNIVRRLLAKIRAIFS